MDHAHAGDLARTAPVDARLVWETGLYSLALVATVVLGVLASTGVIEIAARTRGSAPGGHVFALVVFLVSGLQVVRWIVLLALAMFENVTRRRRGDRAAPAVAPPGRLPRVSVLMPAYDEEDTVERAFRSMQELDYPDVEVVFVDDGSTDRTLELARRFEGRHGNVTIQVHTKPNGGKWSALNYALRHSSGELALFVDADSHLDPQALRYLLATLEARSAVAVAGYVRVRNRGNLLSWLQSLEYLACNGTMRTAQSTSGTVLVVAGPIGLYRRSILERVFENFGTREPPTEVGPMEGDTYAEDFDLSLAVLALDERIVYEPRAVAYTKAPASMGGLLNQRYRWIRGSLQVLRKFFARTRARPELMPPRLFAWLMMCYFMDYAVTPFLVLVGLPFLLIHLGDGGLLASSMPYVLGLLLVSEVAMALCFASTHDEQRRLAAVLPLRGIYSSVFLMSIFPFVLWDELRGSPMRW